MVVLSPPLRLHSDDKDGIEVSYDFGSICDCVIMKTSVLFVSKEQKLHNLRN